QPDPAQSRGLLGAGRCLSRRATPGDCCRRVAVFATHRCIRYDSRRLSPAGQVMAMARVFALLFMIGLTVASLAPLPAAAQSGRGPRPFISEVATIAIRPGATIRAVYWRTLPPAGDVGVAVLLFAGGTGQLRITPSGIV